jgi:hypothetical protein
MLGIWTGILEIDEIGGIRLMDWGFGGMLGLRLME